MEKPFGTWKSPITSKAITAGSVGIGSIFLQKDTLYWIEGRPQEQGRNVLCKLASDGERVDVSPTSLNIRTRVHEYGGAAACPNSDDGFLASDFATQQLGKLENGNFTPITKGESYRFADGTVHDGWCYCIREEHGGSSDVVNTVVRVKIETGEMEVLASGNDFYAAPRISDSGKLAYITWNHPSMPWDATELWVDGKLVAGQDGDTSILQPLWQGEDLYYISDETGYYNIYRMGTKGSILPMEFDFGGAAPGWVFGSQGFCFLPDGRLAAHYSRDGNSVLIIAKVENEQELANDIQEFGMDDGLPRMFGSLLPGPGTTLFMIGASPSTPKSIYRWDYATKQAAEILVSSSNTSYSESVISLPKQIEFPTTLGTAYGYYYAPRNDEYKCESEAPPLLVKAHGGPTACTSTAFNPTIQYWTSRGFGVLDVDYGGSTGYGREYRRRLRGAWGIVDVDDVCNGAKYLVEQGSADPKRLCIDGGSAGGYTTLSALAFRDTFSAGCSLYGVADLEVLAKDTHKFESRYLDGLVGKYPQDQGIYQERSPINKVDGLSCPILLLQGAEDKIVPPNQAELMHAALLKKQIPTCLKIYEDEQHGFRKSENIEDALDSELAFYGRVFGIDVHDAVDIEIDNL